MESRFAGPAAPFQDRQRFRQLCDKLQKLRWVVYCKPPFGDDTQVFRYLGQYTHRVGLSNHRLVAFDGRDVTFRTRGDARVTLEVGQFLRRFVLHVLPKGFVKIRHHGLFAASNVHTKLANSQRTRSAHRPRPRASRAPGLLRHLAAAVTDLHLPTARHLLTMIAVPFSLPWRYPRGHREGLVCLLLHRRLPRRVHRRPPRAPWATHTVTNGPASAPSSRTRVTRDLTALAHRIPRGPLSP